MKKTQWILFLAAAIIIVAMTINSALAYQYAGQWQYTQNSYRSWSYPSYPSYGTHTGTRYYSPTHTWKSGVVYQRQWRGYSQTFFFPNSGW